MCFLCNNILEMLYTEKVGLDCVQLAWLLVAIRKLQLYFSTLGGSFLSSWRLQSLTKYRLSTSILQNISPSPLLMSEVTKYLF